MTHSALILMTILLSIFNAPRYPGTRKKFSKSG